MNQTTKMTVQAIALAVALLIALFAGFTDPKSAMFIFAIGLGVYAWIAYPEAKANLERSSFIYAMSTYLAPTMFSIYWMTNNFSSTRTVFAWLTILYIAGRSAYMILRQYSGIFQDFEERQY